MKVAGFSFVRNAIKYDYPIIEAITSVLPLCDEFIVAVGKSEDATLELVKSIDSEKIKIIETEWDDSLRTGGRVLAIETDKAFDAVSIDADWAFYIQGDEVLHEKYIPIVREAMLKYQNDGKVDGLLFNYTHFYGSYDYIGDARRWYRREIRVIKNDKNIRSYRDAQGFRWRNNQKLKVVHINASIYHYGWVKDPRKQQAKQETFGKLWHDDDYMNKHIPKNINFDYSEVDALAKFEGTHPKVMQERISKINWKFSHDISKKNLSIKEKILQKIENISGWRIGEYRNYKKIN